MRLRKLCALLAATTVALTGVVFGPASPASAAGVPMGLFICGRDDLGRGTVLIKGPTVAAMQGNIRDPNSTAWVSWTPQLFYYNYNTGSWTYWADAPWRYAEARSNTGPSMSTGWGTAGPEWAPSGGAYDDTFTWPAAADTWWAVKHIIYDRGDWSWGWATTTSGSSSCSFS